MDLQMTTEQANVVVIKSGISSNVTNLQSGKNGLINYLGKVFNKTFLKSVNIYVL